MSELERIPQRRWQAEWIWADADGREPNVYYCFRREFSLKRTPKVAELQITADTRYKVWLNGQPIGRGPVYSPPYHHYYDTHEVAGALRRGVNCLAIVVYHIGGQERNRGGLLAELTRGEQVLVATDHDWRVRRATEWLQDTFSFRPNVVNAYQEVFDSRQEPEGWRDHGFDDSRWPYAVSLGRPPVAPWIKLLPRDIPPMRLTPLRPAAVVHTDESRAVTNRTSPLDLSRGLSTAGRSRRLTTCRNAEHLTRDTGEPAVVRSSTVHCQDRTQGVFDPSITLDFGRIVTAYFEIDVAGPAGATIDIGYAERLTDGRFVNSIEGQFASRFVLKGGRQTLRTFNWIAMRFVKIRFRQCDQETQVHAVRAIETAYPYEKIGKFACPDDRLNEIWDISRATLQLCSNESLTDTPWREQGQWLGDVSAVTLGGIYACYGDVALPAKFLRQSAANQLPTGLLTNLTNIYRSNYGQVIPDYSLWWIEAIWQHYLYTGDASWLHRYYPHILKVLDFFYAYLDADGLLDRVPGWVFIDWAYVEKEGSSAPLNAIFAHALTIAGKIAAFKGDTTQAETMQQVRDGIQAAFQPRFFDAERGVFADNWQDGRRGSHVSEHANLMPIVSGLVDQELADSIVSALYEEQRVDFTICEPFFTWQVLKGLDQIDRFDLALAIVRERWGWFLQNGQSSVGEEWNLHGSWRHGETLLTIMRTASHAWSACPAEFLTRHLVGLEILEPGFRRIRLAPRTRQIPSFYVRLPTPHGPLVVQAENGAVTWKAPGEVAVHLSTDEPTIPLKRALPATQS